MDERRRLKKFVFELDSNLSDWELLDQWNMMYENFGCMMSNFRNKWEDERIKEFGKQTFKPSIEFEELIQRVSKLEGQMMSMKFKNINTLG